ncbi:SAM-dependent methyltransferase [Novosphingopyxis baekryungensis]|uniref:SAM-dependent methyltransferase n=1 Tax=Novosphingopyxis baekryungensis TaxID=279369 RepID=UPI0003B39689|nr:SAM-dependent methyltransferase [Novosphingopyxis baekryungensis]
MTEAPSERQARFDQLFAENPDPWDIDTSDYERGKREAVLAALGKRRFVRMLEVGCAGGALTERPAELASSIVALDVSTKAIDLAAKRLPRCDSVEFVVAEVPDYWPAGQFDAVILSEVLYFLSVGEIRQVSQLAHESLTGNGLCLLVNWIGPNDLPVDGDAAVKLFLDAAPWQVAKARREEFYRLDLLVGTHGD